MLIDRVKGFFSSEPKRESKETLAEMKTKLSKMQKGTKEYQKLYEKLRKAAKA